MEEYDARILDDADLTAAMEQHGVLIALSMGELIDGIERMLDHRGLGGNHAAAWSVLKTMVAYMCEGAWAPASLGRSQKPEEESAQKRPASYAKRTGQGAWAPVQPHYSWSASASTPLPDAGRVFWCSVD
jgi:hypothetical protein